MYIDGFFIYIEVPILMKIILCLTQDKITMTLLYCRAYQRSVRFATDHHYYKIVKSPSPVWFQLMLSESVYYTKKETGFAQGTDSQKKKKSIEGLVSVLPSGHGIYSLYSQLLCSLSTASKFSFLFLVLQSLP